MEIAYLDCSATYTPGMEIVEKCLPCVLVTSPPQGHKRVHRAKICEIKILRNMCGAYGALQVVPAIVQEMITITVGSQYFESGPMGARRGWRCYLLFMKSGNSVNFFEINMGCLIICSND